MTRHIVLAGAGHAHAQVLLDWARDPLPGVELTVVSPYPLAPYSGMVPGWLAGLYRFREIVVDFPALCARAGARWIEGEVDTLDAPRRELRLASAQVLPYDLLSLNIGSTLRPPELPQATVLSMRPLAALRTGWHALLDRVGSDASDEPLRLTAVGGGAAGFESLLAARARLRRLQPQRQVFARLISRAPQLLPGVSALARAAALRALQRADVQLHLATAWHADMAAPGEVVLWATGAQAHDWVRDPRRRGALAVDDGGFVRIDEQLRCVSHPQVFAVGDCAAWGAGTSGSLPKAGVFAVRMGPVLIHNLRASLARSTLRTYAPQRRYLVLLATGDRHAIASRGALGASGHWAWRWKDQIDRRFVARFSRDDTPG